MIFLYVQYIQGLCQSRFGSIIFHLSLDTWKVIHLTAAKFRPLGEGFFALYDYTSSVAKEYEEFKLGVSTGHRVFALSVPLWQHLYWHHRCELH
jgi:hypothetical protein